ncbi:MAG: DUF420 domain-containing protein [bacterium JZ-2024 1]
MPLLPSFNALLNLTSAFFLIAGFWFIRKRHIRRHRAMMLSACTTSAIFLLSYLTYHAIHGTTKFQGEGMVRGIYLALLGSHTLLAILVLPLAISAVWLAHRGQFARHFAVARWLFPIWLYVSVTGILVYVMLYHLPGGRS